MPFNFSGISQAKCRSPYTQHDHKSRTNKYITEKLRRNQIALSRQKASDLQAQHRESSIPLRRLLVCGYGSYLVSNFLICVLLKRTTANSDILRRVVQADFNLQPRSSACWTAQLLSAFQGLRGCELVTAYAHYARTPVLQLKQRTEDFSATLKNVSCNKMKFSVSET